MTDDRFVQLEKELTTHIQHVLPQEISPSMVSAASKLLQMLHQAQNAIDQKYQSLAGAPGAPTGTVEFGAGAGCYRTYEQGAIYWEPSLGAYWVHGAIYDRYVALGAESGFLGYPETDETGAPDGQGRFNHFQGGSIYWKAETGAWDIHGAIRDKWAALGWEQSFLGYPLTNETSAPDGIGRYNHFQGGSIYWKPAIGAYEVHGAIRDKWAALGWEQSFLGYPTSDESPWTHPNTSEPGRISQFERGVIAFTNSKGAFALPDTIILSSGSLNTDRPITGWVELMFNSAGDFSYTGHLHDSGGIGYDVSVASVLNFKDAAGNVIAVPKEGHVNGTFTIGSRDLDWEDFGNEPLIRANFDALRSVGMVTSLSVDVTAGDVIETILTSLPIAAGIAVAVIIVAVFASGQKKICPPIPVQRTDPYTGETHSSIQFPIVNGDEQCPSQ